MQKITINTIQDIIEKSQLANPKVEVVEVIDGSQIHLDDISAISTEEKILGEAVAALTKEELAELAAVMCLGKEGGGEYTADFNDLVAEGLNRYDESFADNISSNTLLADYLINGLRILKVNL